MRKKRKSEKMKRRLKMLRTQRQKSWRKKKILLPLKRRRCRREAGAVGDRGPRRRRCQRPPRQQDGQGKKPERFNNVNVSKNPLSNYKRFNVGQ
jgi:hypothetical protein